MSKSRALAASLLLLICETTAHAVPIPGLFNTGVDNANVPLAGGSVDPHYTLIASADPAFPGPSAIVPSVIPTSYWIANSATSKWIAPADIENFPGAGTPHPGGTYTYRISFDLTGIDPSTASIAGAWGVDNSGSIRLNGVLTGVASPSYNPLVAFSIGSGFVSGINNLDFVVVNQGSAGTNPTGLRVNGLVGTGTALAGVPGWTEGRALELSVPFPNPARGLVRFSYTLPVHGTVRLLVRDLAGRTVRALAEGSTQAGRHESAWDGLDAEGTQVGAGVYFVDLLAGGTHLSRRIVWMP